MAGAKLEQAKKALAFCVENLNDGDHFEILRFATEVEPLFNNLTDASTDNRSRAQKFIGDLKPIGGTAINDALKRAVELRPDRGSRPFVVVFLTDGRPTVGDTDENHIVQNATKSKTGLTRIFCFGIGTDVNTHLLDRITEETKAFSQYVLPEEDIEVKVSSFFTKIKEPVLANPKLTFPGDVRVTKLYPSPVPDVFKGEQLILAGRYSGSGSGALHVEGNVAGETRKFAYDLKFPSEESDNEFIPRLWATRRVGYLLDEIRLHGESRELKDEVTELARKYGIVTPYTAYLIIEDERRREVPLSMRTLRESAVDRLSQVRLEEYGDVYQRSKREKDGAGAVADARSFYALKSADAPAQSIVAGNSEALRLNAPAAQSSAPTEPASRAGRTQAARNGTAAGGTVASISGRSRGAQLADEARELERRGRSVAGKTFFANEGKWIDSEVQKKKDAKRLRVTFGSEDYFKLLREKPEAKSWLALGTNVEFTLGDTVYEIVEQ
jgi:Ca-activated chloride channel family protein